MANEQSRITVVGTLRRVDLAVPSAAPIGEYAPRLAELCGQQQAGIMPPAWSLATAGDPPYPLDATLAELNVTDGSVLYLRDLSQEPGDAPVVKDIDEVVADEAAEQRRGRVHAGPAVVGFGLVWLVAATAFIGWRGGVGLGALTMFVLTGVALLGAGWGLGQKPTAVPAAFLPVVSLGAVPCFAVAGMFIADGLAGPDLRWVGAVVGANLATMMALALGPGLVLLAVQIQLLVAAVLAVLVLGLDATAVQSAAVVAAASTGLIAAARRTAATVAAWGGGFHRPSARAAARLVDQSRRALAVVLAGPVAALVVTLPVLALSGKGFAVSVAAVVTVALLARVRRPAFTSELVLIGCAAMVGVFGLVLQLTRLFGRSGTELSLLLLAGGLTVVGVGVAIAVLVPGPAQEQPAAPGGLLKPRRRSRAEVVGMVAGIAVAPLTLGVLGVLSHLVMVGRTLF